MITWHAGKCKYNFFLVSVLFKTKTIEIQRRITSIFMNGKNFNAQYGGIDPPSK